MVHIAICDDNVSELANMAHMLEEYRTSRNLICEYTVFRNGFELISAIEKGKSFEVYCLDIIMPALSGIDVAREIRSLDKNAMILFFTSSSEYALESYTVHAINYVLKPVSMEKFFFALDLVLDRLKIEEDAAIIVKSSEGLQKVLLSSLVYAEVQGRNVSLRLISGKLVECTEAFASICDHLLKFPCFLKPHRSFLVNMQYIDTIGSSFITLQTKKEIPIAQGKVREVKDQYLSYQMEDL